MSAERSLGYSDIVSARERRDPGFGDLVIRYLAQPDPPETAPEEPPLPSDQAPEDLEWAHAGAADPGAEPAAQSGDEDEDDGGWDGDEDEDDGGDDDWDEDEDEDDEDDWDQDEDDGWDQAGSHHIDAGAPSSAGDAWTLGRLRSALSARAMWGKSPEEQRALRRDAWRALLAAPYPPPRLRLGSLLVDVYQEGTAWARTALIEIFARARLGWGIWQGFKRVYKLAEEGHDAAMFGVLAWRLDAVQRTPYHASEISGATLAYMRRRAWRYLRHLGQAVPELYPHFAVQVLRHYPAGFGFTSSWIANQIWAHGDLIGARTAWQSGPPDKLDKRAFDHAWKLAPAPLLQLLEDAHSDEACAFATRGLRADFPELLRGMDPRWLARFGARPLASVHAFVVQVLQGNPALHPSRFAELGLHDMVLGFLRSASEEAGAYAVDYARAHAPDIPVDVLIAVAEEGGKAPRELARARLSALAPAALGLPALVRMLAVGAVADLARDKLNQGFTPGDLSAALYVALASGTSAQQRFVQDFYKRHKQTVPAPLLRALAEHPPLSAWQRRRVLQELGKHQARDIGIDWIRDALLDPRFGDEVEAWLRAGMLKGEDLDVDWVKGLAMRPSRRPLALALLGEPKWIAPHRIGLPWLLAMARQADESLSGFAHRYLLEHFTPEDFAREMGSTDASVGVDRIWSLLAPGQPEPVRRFAAAYLKVHHPELGKASEEARRLGIAPRMSQEAYSFDRVSPLFSDSGQDVRKLARDIGRHELVRWGEPRLLYDLASSPYREARSLAAEALLSIGEPDADPRRAPPVSWLVADRVFALAESPLKATREIALTLIRRHYQTLGGAVRLGWLMESPDREVRLAAVRLLWERHRPLPPGQDEWRGKQGRAAGTDAGRPRTTPLSSAVSAEQVASGERFSTIDALRQFLRAVLFGLPPGRMERREARAEALPDRPLPASRAKRRLIDVVRDMAMEDAGFAAVVVPVLAELAHSQAKGEWQGCVAALARIRHAHPDLGIALADAQTPVTPVTPVTPGPAPAGTADR